MALLPETDGEHAREAGERICSAVEHTSFDMDGNRLTTTVSINTASYSEDAVDVNELMEIADQALYVSKRTGRNRVTLNSKKEKTREESEERELFSFI